MISFDDYFLTIACLFERNAILLHHEKIIYRAFSIYFKVFLFFRIL